MGDNKIVRDDLDKFLRKLQFSYFENKDEEFAKYFFNSYEAGDRTLYFKNKSETKKFDIEWIQTVESYFPSLDKICRNPRSNLKYEEEIVAIEKAKKTNSKSVQHLASHTHLIKDVDEDNFVTPKKILTTFAEQDYAIYENRFIATLIKRLFLFVRNRYEIIKNNVESYQQDHFNAESKFDFNNTNIEMTLDIKIKKDLDDKSINEHNMNLLARVEKLNQLVSGLRNCQFMQLLKDAKPVHPPIMKTNLIIGNPEFRNAYNLWLFLDKYSILGYDVDVKEKDLSFDEPFISELEHLFIVNYVGVIGNQNNRLEQYNTPDGYTEYTKKHTDIATQHPEDFVNNPDLIQVEDTTLNEYFLNKYKELFDKGLNMDNEEGITYTVDESSDEAIKKALRQTIDICNSLYDAKFELEEEEDIFRKLVTEEDLEKEYVTAIEQLRYAYLIHDVKRVDYNNSIRLERKKIKELEDLSKKMIRKLISERKYEQQEKVLKALDEKINAKKAENEDYKNQIAEIDDYTKLNKDEEAKLNQERIDALNRVNEQMKAYDAMMYAKYEEEKERKLAELAAEQERTKQLKEEMKEARKRRRDMINDKLKEERAKAKEDYELRKQLRDEEYAKQIAVIDNMLATERAKMNQEIKAQQELDEQLDRESKAQSLVAKWEEKQVELAEIEAQNKALEEIENAKRAEVEAQILAEKAAIDAAREEMLALKKKEEEEQALIKAQEERESIALAKVKAYEERLRKQEEKEEKKRELARIAAEKKQIEQERLAMKEAKENEKALLLAQKESEKNARDKVKAWEAKMKAEKQALKEEMRKQKEENKIV